MPNRRQCTTQKARIANVAYYLNVGFKADGSVGEIFLDAHSHGTFVRGVLDALARTISLALQHDVPLTEVVDVLRGLNFPPQGAVENSTVKSCVSVVDWVAQELERCL